MRNKYIERYELGLLDNEDTITMFQELLDTGDIVNMNDSFKREAQRLLNEGTINYADRR